MEEQIPDCGDGAGGGPDGDEGGGDSGGRTDSSREVAAVVKVMSTMPPALTTERSIFARPALVCFAESQFFRKRATSLESHVPLRINPARPAGPCPRKMHTDKVLLRLGGLVTLPPWGLPVRRPVVWLPGVLTPDRPGQASPWSVQDGLPKPVEKLVA